MRAVLVLVVLTLSAVAGAAEYRCTVTRKVTREGESTAAELAKWKPHTRIEETKAGAFVSRCGWSEIQKKITCERYEVDRVDVDPHVKIKKMYVFASQFSVQIFPNLNYIEDMGRGIISFGTCEVIAP